MRNLEEILEEFENTRLAFITYRKKGDMKKDALLEYQGRFIDLKAEIRPFKTKLLGETTRRDDKAATAIKFRIAVAIHEGEFKDEEGKLFFEKCSINQAEKFASASKAYKDFLHERVFFKRSYVNLSDVRNDAESYINLTKDLLKNIQ